MRTMARVAALSAGGALLAVLSASLAWAADDRDELDAQRLEVPQEQIEEFATAERLLVDKVNALRVRQDLPELKVDGSLEQAAHYFAYFMAQTGEYGHTADGQRPADRAAGYDYEYCIVAENIAFFETPESLANDALAERLHQAWVDSPEHYENLIDPELTEIGVAIARSPQSGAWYAVQKFGRPRAMQIEFAVANRSGEAISYRIGEREYELPPRYTRTHFRCRAGEMEFAAGAEQEPVQPITINPGATYSVISQDGALRVEEVEQ